MTLDNNESTNAGCIRSYATCIRSFIRSYAVCMQPTCRLHADAGCMHP